LPAAPSSARANVRANSSPYSFQTIDDPANPGTRILGINNQGKLVGSYGSGTGSDPYVGLVVHPPYQAKNFFKEIYPYAIDTVVTCLSNTKIIAGWYEESGGQIFGFTESGNIFSSYKNPHTRGLALQETEILGIMDQGLAVGFWQDDSGVDHAFELNLTTAKFAGISPPGAVSAAATGINGKDDVVGWLINSDKQYEGWLLKGGHYTEFAYANGTQTKPSAINWSDDIVGSYVDAHGNTHGFVLTDALTNPVWAQIDEPNATGYTAIGSVNNYHTLVGYYEDSTGAVNGFLATFNSAKPRQTALNVRPLGKV
jgi:hypothetical protein